MVELKGSLDRVGLPAIVQLLGDLRQSGRLDLTDAGRHGWLGFEAGRLVAAELDDQQGAEGLSALLQTFVHGEFEFDETAPVGNRTLDIPADELAARLTEQAAIGGHAQASPSARNGQSRVPRDGKGRSDRAGAAAGGARASPRGLTLVVGGMLGLVLLGAIGTAVLRSNGQTTDGVAGAITGPGAEQAIPATAGSSATAPGSAGAAASAATVEPASNPPIAAAAPVASPAAVLTTPVSAVSPLAPPSPVAAAAGGPVSASPGQPLLNVRFDTPPDASWVENPPYAAWSQGAYRLQARQATRFVAVGVPVAQPPADVLVSATFRKTGGPPGGGYGLIVRDQGPEPRDGVSQTMNAYVLEAGDVGEFGIWRRDADHWVDLVSWTRTPEVHAGASPNDLAARATGDRLTFTINGVDVATVQDAALASGRVGVFIGGDNNEVALDRIAIQVP